MKSMTGYGYRESQTSEIHLMVDLKSYNNRYLDLVINLPPPLSPLEPRIRAFLSENMDRGRVELAIRMRELTDNISIIIDTETATRYAEALRNLMDSAGIKEELQLSHLLGMEGVVKTDKTRDLDRYWNQILPLLQEARNELELHRREEGEKTRQDIIKQLMLMEESTETIAGFIPELENRIKEDLRSRFTEIIGQEAEESRMMTEIASTLVRHDINEEISRLRGHFQAFRELLDLPGQVGKKLDFLSQELNRETNTIGSKSAWIPISHAVVEMKNAVEKIREQLRNVE